MNESNSFSPICIACTVKTGEKPEENIDVQFERKLKECARQIRDGMKVPKVFKSLNGTVKQAALSHSYLCLLFEDGTVCRIAYQLDDQTEKEAELGAADGVRPPSVKRSSRVVPTRGQQQSTSRANSLRANLDRLAFSAALSSSGQSSDILPQIAAATGAAYSIRSRLVRSAGRGRHGTAVFIGTAGTSASPYPLVPAQNVPEELIEEAQAVLQGKSRSTIIRELQRANLDINIAVNNLLGQDEDMDDGHEDDRFSQDFVSFMDVPGVEAAGAELHPSALLEAASDGQSDDSSCLALRCASLSRRVASVRGEIERERRNSQAWPIGHLSQEQLFGSDEQKKADDAKNETKSSHPFPLKFSPEVEWCRYDPNQPPARFLMISALYSELLLVSADNETLVQWRFDRPLAYTDAKNPSIHHPKLEALGLLGEKILSLSSCVSRATVCTKFTNKVCSFMDSSLGRLASKKLDMPAMSMGSNESLRVYSSCNFSAVLCQSDRLFWWGSMPRKMRIKIMERAKEKSKRTGGIGDDSELTVNSKVILHAARFIQVGAVGCVVKDGVPKIGQLLDSVISTDSTYRFLVRDDLNRTEDILEASELAQYEERHLQAAPGSKRRRPTNDDPDHIESEKSREDPSRIRSSEWYEENWHIGDVVFLEESKITPLGTVLVIDKSHVLIKLAGDDDDKSDNTVLSNTRIFRKDDLRVHDSNCVSHLPDCLQRFPKRVAVDLGQPLAMAVDDEMLHCISVNMNCTAYLSVEMVSSKIVKFFDFPFKIIQNPSDHRTSCLLNLHVPFTNSPVVLRDANSCPLQLRRSPSDSIREVDWNNLFPFTSFAEVIVPLKPGDRFSASGYRLITFATARPPRLIPLIIRAEVEKVLAIVYPEDTEDSTLSENRVTAEELVTERSDGNRNILHVAVSVCFPTSNRAAAKEVSKRKEEKSAPNFQEYGRAWSCTDQGVSQSDEVGVVDDGLEYIWPAASLDPVERESRGGIILKFILESALFSKCIWTLLTTGDYDGHTPFMYAVYGRAYAAAMDLLDRIMDCADGRPDKNEYIRQAIYPAGSSPDDCPLYMLCCNDTCSYTWTGDEHIYQDVFKCYTCNLQGSLCCCTECARLCHKNHDCRLKVTSPTAYCDCREVCRCRALIAGDQTIRADLFKRMLKDTDLALNRNGQGEPISLFLAQTTARQFVEQRQYKGNNRALLRLRRSVAGGASISAFPGSLFTYAQMLRRLRQQRMGTPCNDLPPPTFCSEALELCLSNYNCLRGLFHLGDTSITDRFMLILLTRLPESVMNNLMKSMAKEENRCFVNSYLESVARVTLYLAMITTVDARCTIPISILNGGPKEVGSVRVKQKPLAPLLEKVRSIFTPFPVEGVKTLIDLAEMLIAPVRSGAVGSDINILLYNDLKTAVQAIEETHTQCPDKSGRADFMSKFSDLMRYNAGEHVVSVPSDDSSDRTDEDDRSTISFHNDEDDDRGIIHVESFENDQNHDESGSGDEDETVVVGDQDDTDEEEDDDDEDDEEEEIADDAEGQQIEDAEENDELAADSCASSDDDNESQERSNAAEESFQPDENQSREVSRPAESGGQQNAGSSGAANDVTFASIVADGRDAAPPSTDRTQAVPFAVDTLDARSALCRGYACALRLASFLMSVNGPDEQLEKYVSHKLANTWSWIAALMDMTELRLRHGIWITSLRSRRAAAHPLHSSFLKVVVEETKRIKQAESSQQTSDNSHYSSRQFLYNLQFLTRSHSLYQQHTLPYLYLMSCKHYAYVADASISFSLTMDRSGKRLPFSLPWDNAKNEGAGAKAVTVSKSFFQRSSSTLCIGLDPPDMFKTPVAEALPLVTRPQLLQPDAYREDMWATDGQRSAEEMLSQFIHANESAKSCHLRILNSKCDRMPLGDRSQLSRWRITLDVFSRLFVDSVGAEVDSILPCFSDFQYVENKFRQEAERLRNTVTKEIRFENVERTRQSLIYKLFRSLNVNYIKATATVASPQSSPLLPYSKVRVSFKDEPGEGVGVTRSFYTAVIGELLSDEPLPSLESCQAGRSKERRLSVSPLVASRGIRPRPEENARSRRSLPGEHSESQNVWSPSRRPDTNRSATDGQATAAESSSQFTQMLSFNPTSDEELRSRVTEAIGLLFSSSSSSERPTNSQSSEHVTSRDKDDTPMFWKPQANKEFYAPRPCKPTENRINAFRNVGRLIGLCLINNDILPLYLCRHVIKYMLNRDIGWHDLAFFDSTIYESFRQILCDVEMDPKKDISDIGLRWAVDLRPEEGGGASELCPDGLNVLVTAETLSDYVKAYTQYRLLDFVEPFLKSMQAGLHDVLPHQMTSRLTAEEFRLLLNGSDRIDVKTLYTYTTFIDESGDETPERLERFKRWFWTVVEGMSAEKRQDLVLFWTGSPTLPSSAEGFQAAPSITIRHPDDQHLPTANTCISRLYIPLYSSKRILRHKLCYAIKAKNFGFI